MKRIYILLSLLTFFLTSLNLGEETEARACNTGSYWKIPTDASGRVVAKDGKVALKCVSIKSGGKETTKSQLLGELETMSNGTDISAKSWTYKFGRLMIEISVIVSYATQVLALITIAYSSFLYTTSEGDVRKVRQAKMLIIYAFIGMFISSFALVVANMLGGAI